MGKNCAFFLVIFCITPAIYATNVMTSKKATILPNFSISDLSFKYSCEIVQTQELHRKEHIGRLWSCLIFHLNQALNDHDLYRKFNVYMDMAKLYLATRTCPPWSEFGKFRCELIDSFYYGVILDIKITLNKRNILARAKIINALLYMDYVEQKPSTKSKQFYLRRAFELLIEASFEIDTRIIYENLAALVVQPIFSYRPHGFDGRLCLMLARQWIQKADSISN